MRILVAPSAFTPTLTAVQAAAAITVGWARTAPTDELQVIAVSGGGPGLIDAVQARIPGRLLAARVTGPDGSGQVPAAVLQTPDGVGAGSTAWIEAAQVCAAPARDPSAVPATAAAGSAVGTRGVGELVEVALAAGAGTVVIGVGGCAATDAGAGLLAVLGGGDPLETVGAAVARSAGVRLVIAGTADDPLAPTAPGRDFADRLTAVLGDRAPAEEVPRHPELGERAAAAPPRPRPLPMARPRIDRPLPSRAGAGAGGGLGFALLALGASYRPGISEVLEATGLAAAVAGADLVVTGEGSFDHRSRTGSAVGGVVSAAGAVGVPCIVLAGRCLLGSRETRALGVASAYAVQDDDGWQARGAAENVAQLAARVARTWSRP